MDKLNMTLYGSYCKMLSVDQSKPLITGVDFHFMPKLKDMYNLSSMFTKVAEKGHQRSVLYSPFVSGNTLNQTSKKKALWDFHLYRKLAVPCAIKILKMY